MRPREFTHPLLAPAVVLLYAGWLALVISRHEFGHLESQAWNIVRSASSPGELLALIRVEGHSPVGFLLAWPLTLFGSPVPAQVIGWLTGLLMAVLLVRDRPFPLSLIALALFGHYLSYEYTVAPRTYLLALTGIVLIASALHRQCLGLPLLILLCCLVASSGALGLCLSVPILLVVLHLQRSPASEPGHAGWLADAWALLLLCLNQRVMPWLIVYAVVCGMVAMAILAPGTQTAFGQEVVAGTKVSGATLSRALLAAPLPHVDHVPVLKSLVAVGSSTRWLVIAGALGVFLAIYWLFSPWPVVALAWLLASILIVGVATVTGFTTERVLGHLVLFALLLFWVRPRLLDRPTVSGIPPVHAASRPIRSLFQVTSGAMMVLVLIYHAAIGLALGLVDIRREATPFKAAARTVERLVDGPYHLIVSDAVFTSPLMTYLDKDAFDLGCLCMTRHARWEEIEYRAVPVNVTEAWCAQRNTLADAQHPNAPVVAVLSEQSQSGVDAFLPVDTLAPGFAYSRQPVYDVLLWADPACTDTGAVPSPAPMALPEAR